jgi:mRNA interferase RelE/StbE
MKQVVFSGAALSALTRLPAKTATLIRSKIAQYATAPSSLANNVKALRGRPGYLRLRVGDWRVIFRREAAVIVVVKIGGRGSIYD